MEANRELYYPTRELNPPAPLRPRKRGIPLTIARNESYSTSGVPYERNCIHEQEIPASGVVPRVH